MTTTRIVACAEVHVGDRITEIDTPDGPFYSVVRETEKSFWVDASEPMGYGQQVEVRFGKSPRAGVRVAVSS